MRCSVPFTQDPTRRIEIVRFAIEFLAQITHVHCIDQAGNDEADEQQRRIFRWRAVAFVQH
jgi:uncharacterized protein YnzC (UPF0291/DUF896 family)